MPKNNNNGSKKIIIKKAVQKGGEASYISKFPSIASQPWETVGEAGFNWPLTSKLNNGFVQRNVVCTLGNEEGRWEYNNKSKVEKQKDKSTTEL